MHQLKLDIIDEDENSIKKEYEQTLEYAFQENVKETVDREKSTRGKELNLRETSLAEMSFTLSALDKPEDRFQESKYVFSQSDEASYKAENENSALGVAMTMIGCIVVAALGLLFLPSLNHAIHSSKFSRFVKDLSYPMKDQLYTENRDRIAFGGLLSSVYQENLIPILLKLNGSETMPTWSILSNCLKLKSAKISKYTDIVKVWKYSRSYFSNTFFLEKKKNTHQVDFYTADSVCDIPTVLQRNSNTRYFFIMENPVLHLLERQRQHLKENKNDNNRALDEKVHYNSLTKALLCKKGTDLLTQQDLSQARKILSEKSLVGSKINYLEAINLFQRKFKWNNHGTIDEKCVRSFADKILKRNIVFEKSYASLNFEKAFESNKYDMSLYVEYANNNKVSNGKV